HLPHGVIRHARPLCLVYLSMPGGNLVLKTIPLAHFLHKGRALASGSAADKQASGLQLA
ncbi:hypothetical protein EVAR_101353_1, partial [Eumeta japonica]